MEFFAVLFTFITLWTLINRFFDYRKAKVKGTSDEERQKELEEIRREILSVKEMVADVLLELDRQNRLPSEREPPSRLSPPT